MKQKLLGMFKGRGIQAMAGTGLMAMAGSAQAGTLKTQLTNLICSVAGSSSITMFAGAVAIISFLVLFTLGEGKDGAATILKICIGISGLLFLPNLVNTFQPGLLACGVTGTF